MGEFICGFFFFITGAAMLIYNKPMVEKSLEFQSHLPVEEDDLIFYNRILCVSAGIVTGIAGFLTMLSNR
jgi:hypothetical protein